MPYPQADNDAGHIEGHNKEAGPPNRVLLQEHAWNVICNGILVIVHSRCRHRHTETCYYGCDPHLQVSTTVRISLSQGWVQLGWIPIDQLQNMMRASRGGDIACTSAVEWDMAATWACNQYECILAGQELTQRVTSATGHGYHSRFAKRALACSYMRVFQQSTVEERLTVGVLAPFVFERRVNRMVLP